MFFSLSLCFQVSLVASLGGVFPYKIQLRKRPKMRNIKITK